jgi:hypothetical protein
LASAVLVSLPCGRPYTIVFVLVNEIFRILFFPSEKLVVEKIQAEKDGK